MKQNDIIECLTFFFNKCYLSFNHISTDVTGDKNKLFKKSEKKRIKIKTRDDTEVISYRFGNNYV